MKLKLTEKAANELGKLFVNTIKKRLREKIYPFGNPQRGLSNKIATGDLYNSLRYNVIKTDQDTYTIEFQYLNYFDYVNRGRSSERKRVPIDALLRWISIRKIQPRDYKGRGRYSVKGKLSLAFAIQQNIFKYGIRPAGIIDKTYDSLETFFADPPPTLSKEVNKILELIQEDINNLIENIIDNPQQAIKQ